MSNSILPDPCKICGAEVSTFFCEPIGSRLKEKNICFSCDFHNRRFDQHVDNEDSAVIDGQWYLICPPEKYGPYRGFGGRRFVIEFNDGRRVITTNLWTQGKIPPHMHVPDNAKFIW